MITASWKTGLVNRQCQSFHSIPPISGSLDIVRHKKRKKCMKCGQKKFNGILLQEIDFFYIFIDSH